MGVSKAVEMHRFPHLSWLCLAATVANVAGSGQLFGHRVTKGEVTNQDMNEVAGMAVSRIHDHVLYVHNYQVDDNFLYAVDINTGAELAKFTIQAARNYDWEDMAIGPCVDECRQSGCGPGKPTQHYCMYIADIGSHRGAGAADIIYMIREPAVLQSADLPVVDSLTFSWSEVDAETLMVSPDGRLFVVSKVYTGRAMIAELPSSGWGNTAHTVLDLDQTGILKILSNHNDPQGGDISPDGTEILLVGEEEVFYYRVTDGEYINAVRSIVPRSLLDYSDELDTEAIAWAPDGQGFYILARGVDNFIYFYPKDNSAGAILG